MKKVLIVGVGVGQVPFLESCRSKGYEIIAVSIPGDYPGFKLADKVYYVDIRDKESILKIATEEKIDAILTDQNDVGIVSVAFVAEKLSFRGIGYETALKFTDKYLMREAAKAAGIGVPDFYHTTNLDEAVNIAENMGYPLIIKPVDSCSSRGVRRINSLEDLVREYASTKTYSLQGIVILERFIEGDVYCIDSYTENYECCNLILGITKYFDLPGMFIPAMRIFSSAARLTDHVGKKLLAENKKLVTSMKLPFGITHAEYIYNHEEDKVYLAEIAARGGGNYISSDLIPMASGFNANEALIDYIINGNVHKIDSEKLDDKVAAYVDFGFPANGIVRKISGLEDLKKIPGVFKTQMDDIYVGKNVDKLTNGSQRYGMILIVADSEAECYRIISAVKNTLVIEIETADGLQRQIWGSIK
jgi:carbamoyl-phosphate synthase large subunit